VLNTNMSGGPKADTLGNSIPDNPQCRAILATMFDYNLSRL